MTSAEAKAGVGGVPVSAKLARDKVYLRMVEYLMDRHRIIKTMSDDADAARLEAWIKPAVGRYLEFMQENGYRDGKNGHHRPDHHARALHEKSLGPDVA